jgi:hypothetical protein
VKRRGWSEATRRGQSEDEREDVDVARLGGTEWEYTWLCGGQSETDVA